MESRPLSRHFEFNGVRLPDIDPKLSARGNTHPLLPSVPRYRHGGNHRAGGWSETSWSIASREPSARRGNP
jgi:hypothetical protein